MSPAAATFLMLLVLSGASVGAAWALSHGLTPERGQPRLRRALLLWSVKGLLVPSVIWALMNLGLSWSLQPFMPQVQAAQNSGLGWFPEYLRVVGMLARLLAREPVRQQLLEADSVAAFLAVLAEAGDLPRGTTRSNPK